MKLNVEEQQLILEEFVLVMKRYYPEREKLDVCMDFTAYSKLFDTKALLGFVRYAEYNNLSSGSIKATIGHDLNGIHDKYPDVFLPKTSTYAKHFKGVLNEDTMAEVISNPKEAI